MRSVFVAVYLLCAVNAEVSKPEKATTETAKKETTETAEKATTQTNLIETPPKQATAETATSEKADTQNKLEDDDDIDMNMLLEKMNDDAFLDKVVEKMVDKLFAQDTTDSEPAIDFTQLLNDPKTQQAAEDFNRLVEEYSKQYEKLSKMSDEEYDEHLKELSAKLQAETEQQEDAEDEEDTNDEEDTQEDEEADNSQMFLAQRDDEGNPLFKLCDPLTLTMSSLAGVAMAFVVVFIKDKTQKAAVDLSHPMLG